MQRSHPATHVKVMQGHYYSVSLQSEKELQLVKENHFLSVETPYPCRTEQTPFQRAIKDKKVLLLTAGQRLQQRSGSSTEGHKEGKWGPGTAWESRLRAGPSQAQATLSTNQPDVRTWPKREERTWEVWKCLLLLAAEGRKRDAQTQKTVVIPVGRLLVKAVPIIYFPDPTLFQ